MLSRPFTGVIAAPLLPMHEGGDIDWATLERYMDWIAAQKPAAIVMNMDASEVIALEDDEQRQVIRVCKNAIAGRVPFLSGIGAGSTRAAAAKAASFREAGAEGLTVFPPFPTFSGSPVPEDMIVRYHRAIAEASDLPIICFQFPKGWGPDYTPEILRAIAGIPQLIAIKESSFDIGQTLQTIEVARNLPAPIGVLTGSDTFIFEAMMMGCDGALIGFAGTATAELVAMHDGVRSGDFAAARDLGQVGADRALLLAAAHTRLPPAHEGGLAPAGTLSLGRVPRAAAGRCGIRAARTGAAVPQARAGRLMGLLGKGAVAIWHDIAPEGRDAFYAWHGQEHMPERVGIPGFLRGRRYIGIDARVEFFNLYEAASIEVLQGNDYADRVNHPTPWTLATVQHFRSVSRSICRVGGTFGQAQGGLLATLRYDVSAENAEAHLASLHRQFLPALAGEADVAGAHVLVADEQSSSQPNAEQRARGVANAVPRWIILLEGWADEQPFIALARAQLEPEKMQSIGAAGPANSTSTGIRSRT